nr:retrovirus-related Pol polyprotein from transposon TNT 1-94 [Tanacetum cinerariifolium]
EAVNTACYVQNRVLVNKSQNKTPYELFIGRAPAIGFLKPFGCHVMILNTLDNLGKFEAKGDEGTISTNLSGTKDAANQEVRNNESSPRYILLPNWAHDALLEATSSKSYQESSSQVPEGSGNPNSTASTFNPSAEQMETLTVESPIPTASSPVPTACLNDSSETS